MSEVIRFEKKEGNFKAAKLVCKSTDAQKGVDMDKLFVCKINGVPSICGTDGLRLTWMPCKEKIGMYRIAANTAKEIIVERCGDIGGWEEKLNSVVRVPDGQKHLSITKNKWNGGGLTESLYKMYSNGFKVNVSFIEDILSVSDAGVWALFCNSDDPEPTMFFFEIGGVASQVLMGMNF